MYIGTAAWSLPRDVAHQFPGEGPHLERYARQFACVEINTSFYRSHRAETYARWAGMTPPQFRFAVKLPRTITHDAALRGTRRPLRGFLEETAGLGDRLGVLLVQLPPSLAWDARVARTRNLSAESARRWLRGHQLREIRSLVCKSNFRPCSPGSPGSQTNRTRRGIHATLVKLWRKCFGVRELAPALRCSAARNFRREGLRSAGVSPAGGPPLPRDITLGSEQKT